MTTVADYLDTWLATRDETGTSPHTPRSYRDTARLHITPRLGDVDLADLTTRRVKAFMRSMMMAGYAESTVGHARAVLSAAMGQAVADGLIESNPVEPIPTLARGSTGATLDLDQARRLLHQVAGDRLEALYAISLALGLRQGEALGLRWSDIEFPSRRVHVRRQLHRVDGEWTLAPFRQRAPRTLRLPVFVADALRRRRRIQEREETKAPEFAEWDLCFTRTDGQPIHVATLRKALLRHLRDAGLPPMRWQGLRDTTEALLVDAGYAWMRLRGFLDQIRASRRAEFYEQELPLVVNDVAELMDGLFGPGAEG